MQPQSVNPIATPNSPCSKNFQKIYISIRYLLTVINIVAPHFPLYQLSIPLEKLTKNPTHHYIFSFDPETNPIYFDETTIDFPKKISSLFAMSLGLILLGVWIRIRSNLISANCNFLTI